MRKSVKRYVVLLLFSCLLLTGCTKQSPQQQELSLILRQFEQLNKYLTSIDQTYAAQFASYCSLKQDFVQINNAENLIELINEWQRERETLFINYSALNFTASNTDVKRFQKEEIVEKLIQLNKHLREYNRFIDKDALLSAECKPIYTADRFQYTNSTVQKTCIFSCKKLLELSSQIMNLGPRNKMAIEATKNALTVK